MSAVAASMSSSTPNRFIGFLLSIECKNVFYQGIVHSIDVDRDLLSLKNCFQNGVSCGEKMIDIKITEIDNIEILADASNALNMLKPKPVMPSYSNSKLHGETSSYNNSNNNNGNYNNNHNSKQTSISNSASFTRAPYQPPQPYSRHNQHHSEDELTTSRSSATTSSRRRKEAAMFKQNVNGSGRGGRDNHSSSSNGSFDALNKNSLMEEFDFEKNLALFDKNAFYEEMMGGDSSSLQHHQQRPGSSNHLPIATSRSATSSSHNLSRISGGGGDNGNGSLASGATNFGRNYRYDEMILDTGDPIDFQQIKVPRASKHFVTDEGYVVPCIDFELRARLFDESYRQGLSKSRQIECMGRCCAEMALQLVGGSVRFSVKNNHQKPSFLILANCSSLQGAYALSAARLLANRNAKIHVLVYSGSPSGGVLTDLNRLGSINDEITRLFLTEYMLLKSTDPANLRLVRSLDEIQDLGSLDLILNGLEASLEQKPFLTNNSWIKNLVKQIEISKAYVVTIDPSGEPSLIQSKWSVCPVLPFDLPKQAGRVFLCDLGFTKGIFQAVGIKYQSPFGSKFLIPLHND